MRLLRVAERLFAREGIDAVSMRRICSEAGQRNNNALQYHFGDKPHLIEAILEDRMTQVNEERSGLLAAIDDSPGAAGLPALVEAMVLPLVRLVAQEEGGRDYVHFLAELFARGLVESHLSAPQPWLAAQSEIVRRIGDALPELSESERSIRIGLMADQIVQALSRELTRQSRRGQAPVLEAERLERFGRVLVGYVVGALQAPPRLSPTGG